MLGLCLHEGFAPGQLYRLGCKDVRGVVWGCVCTRALHQGITRLGCKDVKGLCGAVFAPGLCTRAESHKAVV